MGLDLRQRVPRFFSSLRPGAPAAADVEWAESWLNERERRLFALMSNPDRRHAVRVARRVEAALADLPGRTVDDVPESVVLASALLHDVGKTEAGLGTYGRVVATLSGAVGGLDLAEIWQAKSGFTRRVGLYLRYPVLGVELLRLAESDERVIAWSHEHHLPEEDWSVPIAFGRILAAADE